MTMPVEQQFYQSANAYYQGAALLMKPPESGEPNPFLVQPSVTCAALALKLYLKSLLAIDGGDREDKVTDIADLYRALSSKRKEALLAKFDELSNSQMASDELIKHLDALDGAFVCWRYVHEEDAQSLNLEDLEEMILAAKATIEAEKPEWQQ